MILPSVLDEFKSKSKYKMGLEEEKQERQNPGNNNA